MCFSAGGWSGSSSNYSSPTQSVRAIMPHDGRGLRTSGRAPPGAAPPPRTPHRVYRGGGAAPLRAGQRVPWYHGPGPAGGAGRWGRDGTGRDGPGWSGRNWGSVTPDAPFSAGPGAALALLWLLVRAAAPPAVCPPGDAGCRLLSVADLFDRVIRHSGRIHSLSTELVSAGPTPRREEGRGGPVGLLRFSSPAGEVLNAPWQRAGQAREEVPHGHHADPQRQRVRPENHGKACRDAGWTHPSLFCPIIKDACVDMYVYGDVRYFAFTNCNGGFVVVLHPSDRRPFACCLWLCAKEQLSCDCDVC